MTPLKRQFILIGLMLLLLAMAAVWSTNTMIAESESARSAAEDIASCKVLAATIESLREKPAIASVSAMGVQELGERIEAASRQAQLPPSSLEGVFPQASRRVGDSAYLSKPTSLSLRGVTLEQLVTLLFHLTDGSGLSARDLRLRTPHGGAPSNIWDADVTLSYLVYSPPTRTRRQQ